MKRTAIIGFGAAGFSALQAMRESGYDDCIDVYSSDNLPPANPMLTTYYAAGKIRYEAMFPFGSLEDIVKKYPCELKPSEPITRLCAHDRVVETVQGRFEPYDNILISSGAEAFIPPTGAFPETYTFPMRTPAHAVRLSRRLEDRPVKRAVVIGASMAGIKVAEVLADAGADCLMADMADRIFPQAALPGISDVIQQRLSRRGLKLMFGTPLTGITEVPGGICVTLGREEVYADILCLCIGTRASIDFVDDGELSINRGVDVNEYMQTSVPGIYAAGDCCRANNIQTGEKSNIGLWQNARLQGRAAGFAMAGHPRKYEGSILHNITHFMDMDFISMGDVSAKGELLSAGGEDKGFYLSAVINDGCPVCVNILDNFGISGPLKSYLVKRFSGIDTQIDPQLVALLRKYGLMSDTIRKLEGLV